MQKQGLEPHAEVQEQMGEEGEMGGGQGGLLPGRAVQELARLQE